MLICFTSTVKQVLFAFVNHAWIRSWDQPVLIGPRTYDWQASTDYEPDAIRIAPRRTSPFLCIWTKGEQM